MIEKTHKTRLFVSGLILTAIALTLLLGTDSVAHAKPSQRLPYAAETPTVPAPTAVAATVTAVPVPMVYGDPYVLKTVNVAQVKPDGIIEFTLIVGNKGNADAVNVQVRDTLSNHLDVVSVTTTKGTATVTGRNILVDIGTVGVNELITIKITARGNTTMTAGSCGNLAALNTTSGGDQVSNNTSGVNYVCGEVVIPETGGAADNTHDASLTWLLLAGGLLLLLGSSRWAGQNENSL